MPAVRDPLSVYYDDFSQRFLALMFDQVGQWRTALVRSPAADPVDARGLTAHERAAQRSLFYTLNSTDATGPLGGRWVKNEEWSLTLQWDAPAYDGGILARIFRRGPRRRTVAGRITPGAVARRHVPSTGYVFNPAEQSQNLAL